MAIAFETILKAAAAVAAVHGTAEQRMVALGNEFETVPVVTLAEALVVANGMTMAQYRAIVQCGFDFDAGTIPQE